MNKNRLRSSQSILIQYLTGELKQKFLVAPWFMDSYSMSTCRTNSVKKLLIYILKQSVRKMSLPQFTVLHWMGPCSLVALPPRRNGNPLDFPPSASCGPCFQETGGDCLQACNTDPQLQLKAVNKHTEYIKRVPFNGGKGFEKRITYYKPWNFWWRI